MKKLLLTGILAVLFSGQAAFAQIADGSYLTEDITFTDLDGQTHSIYEYLDEGKIVVLDLFAEWCGPCWNYHNTGTSHPYGGALKTLYNNYGPNGTDELMVFAIETDSQTAQSLMYGGAGTNGWDWVSGTPYPMANADIGDIFEQAFYPYIVRICPNRQIFELGQNSASAIYSATQSCATTNGNVNPALTMYTGEVAVGCEGGDANLSLILQNMGNNILTSATIEVSEGDDNLLSYDWTGSLGSYGMDEIDLGSIEVENTMTLTFEITSTDENPDDAQLEQTITLPAEATEIELHFYTDNYPSESSWQLRNSSHQTVASGGPYTPGTDDEYGGGGPDAMTTKIHEITLPDEDDCYYVRVYDSFGDGLMYGENPVGFFGFELFSEGESIGAFELGNFGPVTNVDDVVKSAASTSVNEMALAEEFSVFPNPVVNTAMIQTVLNESSEVTIEVFDLTGKVVYSENMGTQPAGSFNKTIDFGSINTGMYLLNMRAGEASVVRKLSVNK